MNLDLGGTGNKYTSLLLNPKKFSKVKVIRVKNKILRNSVSVFRFISKKHNNFKVTKANDHINSLSASNVFNSKNSSLSISRMIRKNYKKLQHGQCFCPNDMAEASAHVHSPIPSKKYHLAIFSVINSIRENPTNRQNPIYGDSGLLISFQPVVNATSHNHQKYSIHIILLNLLKLSFTGSHILKKFETKENQRSSKL
jgi:hypothetical protein